MLLKPLRFLPERMLLRHRDLSQRHGLAPAGLAHVTPDGRLADVGAVLLDETLPDAPSRVALLLRRVPVGLEPAVDRRLPGVERWLLNRLASPRTDSPSR
jgi:hypothetical protein